MGPRGRNPYARGMERLVTAVSDLSLASDVQSILQIVRSAAREMTNADGATFILRDGDYCHYVDEDAISPLWKGKRFRMTAWISGWAMLHKQSVVLEDIYSDARISAAAYLPTFVKSLAIVPIRSADPIGAIGTYWATRHKAKPHELELLQALADSTAVALQNIQTHQELEARVRERTKELENINTELNAFSYSVSHDLRAPLRAISAFASMLLQDHGTLETEEARQRLRCILKATHRMEALIRDLLELSQATRLPVTREHVDLSAMARDILRDLHDRTPGQLVDTRIADGIGGYCDARLVRIALENLLGNAWKFTAQREPATISFGVTDHVYAIRDNGAGFDTTEAKHLFEPFQRFHIQDQFAGTGLGLATVKRVIDKHGGRIWVESQIDHGATFYFTLA